MGKHFYQDFKKEIEEEHEALETHQEKKEVDFTPCGHSKIKFVRDDKGQRLVCGCGATFQGQGLNELYKMLTNKL